MAKTTEIKASSGGRDNPQVKGSLGSSYDPGSPGAKKAAAEIAEGLAPPKPSSSATVQDHKSYKPLAPEARPGFRLVKELGPDERVVGMFEFRGKILVATTKGIYRLSDKGDVLEPLLFEVEDIKPEQKPTEGTGKSK